MYELPLSRRVSRNPAQSYTILKSMSLSTQNSALTLSLLMWSDGKAQPEHLISDASFPVQSHHLHFPSFVGELALMHRILLPVYLLCWLLALALKWNNPPPTPQSWQWRKCNYNVAVLPQAQAFFDDSISKRCWTPTLSPVLIGSCANVLNIFYEFCCLD